ncbi:MAG: phage holin family protein [Chloroflexi bacterium]|nr:phage holin family protein [Chloroflexota bacterium]
MRRLLVNWVAAVDGQATAGALLGGSLDLPPTTSEEYWRTLAGFAAAFAVLTTYVRPLVFRLLGPVGCALTVLTLGSIHLVAAGLLFWVTLQLPLAVSVDGPLTTLATAAIIAVISVVAWQILGSETQDRRRR